MVAVDELIESGADAAAFADVDLGTTMRAAYVRRQDQQMFDGVDLRERDPAKALHVGEVAIPDVGPGEALVRVMASAINYNTVWTSLFAPVSTFGFLDRLDASGIMPSKHGLDHHIPGSDASGVVVKVGPGVTAWKPGDRVTVHCNSVPLEAPQGHEDSMLDPAQKIWGYETNFGAFADYTLVRANQLMRKPEHLTWAEAGSLSLVLATSYRMLVGDNAARMKQGDVVLIWGATGGLGGFATQLVLNGGGIPVCVVSSQDKADLLREIGVDAVIDRKAEGYRFFNDDGDMDFDEMKRFGSRIRELVGRDPDIVFEHPGRATFGASVFVTRRGGTIVTCASTSGYEHVYDNRYLWMHLKRILGSHFANYAEAAAANSLVESGAIHPILSQAVPLDDVAEAVGKVHRNEHAGKVGVLVGAASIDAGVINTELRARHAEDISRYSTLG